MSRARTGGCGFKPHSPELFLGRKGSGRHHEARLNVPDSSDIEADIQDIAVLDPVILTFQTEEPLFTDAFL
jgi:hypothetical protein